MHISWNEVFSKILNPWCRKIWYLIWKPRLFPLEKKTSPKEFSASKCDIGNGYFQNLRNFLWNCWGIYWVRQYFISNSIKLVWLKKGQKTHKPSKTKLFLLFPQLLSQFFHFPSTWSPLSSTSVEHHGWSCSFAVNLLYDVPLYLNGKTHGLLASGPQP